MMRLNNGSSSSVASKDKELPPVPPKADGSLLNVKTLNRKNFKKLQLHHDLDSTIPPNLEHNSPESGPLKNKRTLLNLNLGGNSNFQNPGFVNSSASGHRNLDPDSVSSTDNIINQISTLELAHQPHKSKFIRKKQTVISSISPTKSTSSMHSPSEPGGGDTGNISPIYSTTTSFKFNSKDLVTLKNLGSGNSGTVSKTLHIPTQRIMAKKIIPIESNSLIQNQIIRELKILHECQSPYIIEFFGVFINNNNTVVICMEYCNCGSLDKILGLLRPRQFPLVVLKKLSYSMLRGLVYLYENHKIIHRDIKPSNVLMTHKGQFKLCDFGVSRELTNSLAMADTFVGTSTYMSPERIQGLEYGIKSDIWSMGLMLIELASGRSIWHEDFDDKNNTNDNNDHHSQSSTSDDFTSNPGPEGILDLLQRIVNEDPPCLLNLINPVTKQKYDPELCQFINYCLIKDDKQRKSPWELLSLQDCTFLQDVKKPEYEKEVRTWAKMIRNLHKEKQDQQDREKDKRKR
ncbi:hypothetical protein CANTEDRAFT_131568 [Yamadazyma tenuis ATCC 10573]|uniref:Protein kinase domain-containing protein n=1 Tax=Candida tenuis (strain ATCC 10573 / BCRC 21748 / CBS 615 / JCM 9827 / NBRC 10315 / NRRL Y-1498 / VKM Y-70) TaxID=590646 RepID=G3BBC8_CANTC|nr:uncharacterized protein CANTEDRAFT_131568 [Yamadazyma tenuis ATCC 10573]EGV62154.1 hypothetical protein CANTEDRAFT_131568 [Yamadazyma tenuis ATCC 10573]